MRQHRANDRLIGNEVIAAAVDGPENATFVRNGCQLSITAALEVTAGSGTVTINGSDVSVNQQSETLTDITGQTTNSAYRYHTFSVDGTGTLVIQSSNVGDFDASSPDQPPTTQVTEPRHPEGNVYLGVAFQIEGQIEEIYDGRYIVGTQPNDIITQGEGSGLDADTLRTLAPVDIQSPVFGDGSDGNVTFASDQTISENVYAETITIESGVTLTLADTSVALFARDSIEHNGTITANGAGGAGGAGGADGAGGGGDGSVGDDGARVDFFGTTGTGGSGSTDANTAGGAGGTGAGGGGGATPNFTGGDGGDALGAKNPSAEDSVRSGLSSAVTSRVVSKLATIGSGGGGGGGGGSGGTSGVGDGGNGGDGAGAVVLVGRQISGSGAITAAGIDGANGDDATGSTVEEGGGGGGGGGTGGLILLVSNDLATGNVTTDVSGGVGGAGGSGQNGGSAGGAGGDGDDGLVVEVEAPQTPL